METRDGEGPDEAEHPGFGEWQWGYPSSTWSRWGIGEEGDEEGGDEAFEDQDLTENHQICDILWPSLQKRRCQKTSASSFRASAPQWSHWSFWRQMATISSKRVCGLWHQMTWRNFIAFWRSRRADTAMEATRSGSRMRKRQYLHTGTYTYSFTLLYWQSKNQTIPNVASWKIMKKNRF